ncbi:PQQ-binding-like beta-propeller repeat protein [Haloarchaeobius sp. HME9146]|uniref:outer membrane protein assembly factor BamB family protein n=1 Tax=Haloarchaeobius sp. HME9146 TaxID=2978732 RepID=UPI0021BFF961|nr:PQQ-binding-like beta-propeller repeat protein [Haloarchaeobius sp. HME9146]MCT9097130.1 PQQ-binding-like beta-propeller repeat protein [Haloarchaeobius sp. HME9146]
MPSRRDYCKRIALAAGGIGLAGCATTLSDRTDPAGGPGTGDEPTTPASDAGPVDWTEFGVDPGNTGFAPGNTGPGDPSVAWTGIGSKATVNCSPAVAAGSVFVGGDAVYAFDAESGERRWRYQTGTFVPCAPAAVDGVVYTAHSDGAVLALDAETGEEVWTHETNHNLWSSALTVHEGTVYVGTAGTMPAVVSGDTDESKAGLLVALDADSGDRQWRFEASDWFTGPALGDGLVFAGNEEGRFYAVDAETGQEQWRWDAETFAAPPTYHDGTVYVGLHGSGACVALDAESGEVRWRTDLGTPNVKCSPAVDGTHVYVAGKRTTGVLLGGGSESSETATTTTETTTASGPAADGNYGRLQALSVEDGSVTWTYDSEGDFRSSPAVTGDAVYVGNGDGIVSVAREDGRERWRVAFGKYVNSSPAVVEGRVYIGCSDGNLYCLADDS